MPGHFIPASERQLCAVCFDCNRHGITYPINVKMSFSTNNINTPVLPFEANKRNLFELIRCNRHRMVFMVCIVRHRKSSLLNTLFTHTFNALLMSRLFPSFLLESKRFLTHYAACIHSITLALAFCESIDRFIYSKSRE